MSSFTHGYALLVGVGQSAYQGWSLPVTVKDAQAVRATLTDPNLCGYPNDDSHIKLLRDTGATRQGILDSLHWLKQQADADTDSIIIFYYSGHGWLDPTTNQYYLIPHDVVPFDVANSALPGEVFSQALRSISAQRLLVILDCCHAAGMATAKKGQAVLELPASLTPAAPPKGLVADLKHGAGRAVFLSSRGDQLSWILPDQSMSVYTHFLLEALFGAANKPGDSYVLLSNLMAHVSRTVPAQVRALYNVDQTPFFDMATEDFPVALLRGGKGISPDDHATARYDASAIQHHQSSTPGMQTMNATNRSIAVGNQYGGSIRQFNFPQPDRDDQDR